MVCFRMCPAKYAAAVLVGDEQALSCFCEVPGRVCAAITESGAHSARANAVGRARAKSIENELQLRLALGLCLHRSTMPRPAGPFHGGQGGPDSKDPLPDHYAVRGSARALRRDTLCLLT